MQGNVRFADADLVHMDLFIGELNWGYTSFDDLGASFLTIFQVRERRTVSRRCVGVCPA